jgi:hypothetical protein
MHWYREEYDYACANILLGLIDGRRAIFIDNHLIGQDHDEGLFLHLDKLIDPSTPVPLRVLSTSKAFAASDHLVQTIAPEFWCERRRAIGERLMPDRFFYRRNAQTQAAPVREAPSCRGFGVARAGDLPDGQANQFDWPDIATLDPPKMCKIGMRLKTKFMSEFKLI